MKRWWLMIVLLLSLGLNVGWIGHRLWSQHKASSRAASFAELAGEDSADTLGPGSTRPGVGDDEMRPMPRLLERMADELHLEGDERTEFLQLQREYFRRSFRGRRSVADLHYQVRQEIMRQTADRQRVDRLLQQISELQLGLEQEFVDHLFASRQLLDGPRDRRFLRMMARWRKQRVQRRGMADSWRETRRPE